MDLIPDQGFAALTHTATGPSLAQVLRAAGIEAPQVVVGDGVEAATWGMQAPATADPSLLLCAMARHHERDLGPGEVRRLLLSEPAALEGVMPTFAAAAWDSPSRLVVAVDRLGFRQVFAAEGAGWAMLSTSAKACAAAAGGSLDEEALAVQALLGWQLGQRTVYAGVRKLEPGTLAALAAGRLETDRYRHDATGELDAGLAVRDSATVLRDYLSAYLDDHPDAGLQLTGGMDSRLLLSAIPVERRAGLRAVTLGLPGVPDVEIAGDLARRYGMKHEVLSLDGLEALPPADVESLCLAAARRLDFSADPLAYAALAHAEDRALVGPRISGLGGEVARGFYYVGRLGDPRVTRRRARRLASWRMFANEAVPRDVLDPAFASFGRRTALAEVERVLMASGLPWPAATDELYLGHRMQRWGGATETAVCLDREVVNPMLDDRFLDIVSRLSPEEKRGSRFLARLQVALDEELARIPLDGRPPPATYVSRTPARRAQLATAKAGLLRRKVVQRVSRASRPPAGGSVLAQALVTHWRESPAALEAAGSTGVFRPAWLDAVVAGEAEVPPAAAALLVNLAAATA